MMESWDEAAAVSRASLQRRIPRLARLWAAEVETGCHAPAWLSERRIGTLVYACGKLVFIAFGAAFDAIKNPAEMASTTTPRMAAQI